MITLRQITLIVLRISGDTPDEVDVDLDDIIISEEDDVDMENIDLSVRKA